MNDIARFAAKLRRDVDETAWKSEWSRKIADEMRSRIPVATGAARASIRVTEDGVEVGVRYGVFLERGTSRMAPRPFAGPAVNRLVRPSAKDLGDRVIRQIT